MSATDADVRALEHLAYRIREDTYGLKPWDRAGTHTVFQRELVGLHLPTAIEMVTRHAADPEAKTPAAIKRPFLPPAAKDLARKDIPPRDRAYCSVHPDNPPPPHCPACATEPFTAWYDADDGLPPLPENVHPADAARIAAGLPPRHQEIE